MTRLGEIVDILGTVNDDRGHCRWLADTVERHAVDAGIQLPTLTPQVPGVESPGLEIGP